MNQRLGSTAGARRDELDYHVFFRPAEDEMMLVGADREISGANPAACRLLGRTREELAGARLDDLFDPSYPILEPAWEELRAEGSFYVSARLPRADGSSSPAQVSAMGDGEGSLGVVIKETEEREKGETPQASAGASAADYKVMVENSVDAIMVSNPDNTIRYANLALEQVMGYELEELAGIFVPNIVYLEDVARMVVINAEIENSEGPYMTPGRVPLPAQGRPLGLPGDDAEQPDGRPGGAGHRVQLPRRD